MEVPQREGKLRNGRHLNADEILEYEMERWGPEGLVGWEAGDEGGRGGSLMLGSCHGHVRFNQRGATGLSRGGPGLEKACIHVGREDPRRHCSRSTATRCPSKG